MRCTGSKQILLEAFQSRSAGMAPPSLRQGSGLRCAQTELLPAPNSFTLGDLLGARAMVRCCAGHPSRGHLNPHTIDEPVSKSRVLLCCFPCRDQ